MRNLVASKIGILAFLLAIVISGCGSGHDYNPNAGVPGDPLTPPTVTVVTPPDGNVITCPDIPIVTATFSKAMNPATLKTSTFTLTAAGVNVAGAVTYDATANTATFTPTTALQASTKFTATITTGVADTFGNTLATNFVWAFTTSTSCAALPPTLTFVTPPDLSVGICPNTSLVSATFSKAMDPKTINTSTFTLTDPSGTNVAGAVAYVAASNVATFTPALSLTLNTQFAATITTGATDTFGHTLQANKVWRFTTAANAASCSTPPPVISLGSACRFGILAGSTVTNVTGTATTVSGDVGVWPGSAITGFGTPAKITGALHLGDAVAQTAQGNLTQAYNAAAGAAGGAVLLGDIGGLPAAFPPGVYRTTSAQPTLGITGNLTLDGQGDSNAHWIFQIASSLTTAAGHSQVILINGAQPQNVFWQVSSSATLGTNTAFAGNIMALASVSMNTGATLNGRALARNGAVTMSTNTVVVPPVCQ